MDPADATQRIGVEVIYAAAPHRIDRTRVELAAPCTAWQAVEASGVLARHALVAEGLEIGVWGRLCERDQPLRERDRVEIYRALTVDPKEARRLRYRRSRKA